MTWPKCNTLLGLLLGLLPILAWGQAVDQHRAGLYVATESGATCSQATLSAAISVAASRGIPVWVPTVDRAKAACTWSITSNFTPTVQLIIPEGTKIDVAPGVTLTFNACPAAGRYRIFGQSDGDPIEGTVAGLAAVCQEVFPEWWGGLGDGTTDNLAAMNVTLQAAEGGKVTLSPGQTYMTSGTLRLYKNTVFDGQGATVKFATLGSNLAIMARQNTVTEILDKVKVLNTTFDCNRAANGTAEFGGGLQLGVVTNSEIIGNTITGCSGHSLQISGNETEGSSAYNLIMGNRILDYGEPDFAGQGLFIFIGSHHNRIIGNLIHNTGSKGGPGIALDDESSGSFSAYTHHNTVSANIVTGTRRGIITEGGKWETITGNTVSNCIDSFGIWLDNGSVGSNGRSDLDAEYNTVSGNTIDNCTSGIGDYGSFSTITGNTISNISGIGISKALRATNGSVICANQIREIGGAGIYVQIGERLLICDNLLDVIGTDGIVLDNDDGTLREVTIQGNKLTRVQQHGVRLIKNPGTMERVSVIGNTFGDLSLASSGTYYMVINEGAFTNLTVTDNVYTGTETLAGLLSIAATDVYATRNTRISQGPDILTLANDGNPTVKNGDIFVTGGTTTITAIAGCSPGKRVTIVAAHTVTINHNAAQQRLAGAGNFGMTLHDALTLECMADSIWTEVSRSIN